MTNREMKTLKSLKQTIKPQSASADVNGTDVDLSGFDAATIEVSVGTASGVDGSNYVEYEVQHSDDDGAGAPAAYSAVANSDLTNYVSGTNTGTICKIDAATEDDLIYTAGYIGSKKWVRVVQNITGTVTVLSSVTVIRERPSLAPTTNN